MEFGEELTEGRQNGEGWEDYFREVKKVTVIAVPMVVVSLLPYLMQMVAVVMVGHVDELSLSSLAIATSLTNVTGFSLLSGLVGGLETLCGQAFGAKQHNKVRVYSCSAIISLLLVCIPISISWIYIDKFLILIGHNPLISHEARKYSIYLIPSLFSGAIVKPLVRSLQSQSLTLPLLVSSTLALCFHVPLCWGLIFKLNMGSVGAATAFSLSNWFYLILIVLYFKFSSLCENVGVTFSMDAIVGMKEFILFAVPSAVMPQMVVIGTARFNIRLVTKSTARNITSFDMISTLVSISLTISTLHFTIPYGFGAAASTRVSNEIGAGNPRAARLAVCMVMFLAVTEALIVSIAIFSFPHYLGYAFSNEMEVVSYVVSMSPFIAISIITDSLQAVISGIARGSGWQHIGAYVTLGAFYLFGIPAAVVLGFPLHLKAKGLWIGIVIGSIIQSTSLLLITGLTDWRKQALKAKERMWKVSSILVDKDIEIKE